MSTPDSWRTAPYDASSLGPPVSERPDAPDVEATCPCVCSCHRVLRTWRACGKPIHSVAVARGVAWCSGCLAICEPD